MTAAGARAITYTVVAFLAVLTVAAAPSDPVRVPRPMARATASGVGSGMDAASESGPDDSALATSRDGPPRLAPLVVVPATATDTVVVAARIRSNLYAALDTSTAAAVPLHARWKLAWSIADIFEYRIDMSRDLRVGDQVRVLVERVFDPEHGIRLGRVLAASFVASHDTLTAVRFAPPESDGNEPSAADYFDKHGRSLRAAFLRAPLQFRRVSSGFGMRLHPILKIWREHKGTDYVAPAGTPVRAIGDGVVLFVGRKGGYGNAIDIRHPNGYVTRYGHLSRFTPGLHAGSRVQIGETIAYVGMTGLATAPHLHFEVLVGGVQKDPRSALRDRGSSAPVPAAERPAFEQTARVLLSQLNGDASERTVASTDS